MPTPPGPDVDVLFATAAGSWELDRDAAALVDACEQLDLVVAPAVWDDPEVDWSVPLVVVRSTWDYTERLDAFLNWASRVERVAPLVNPSPILRWTTDKRYLSVLGAAGVPTVPGEILEPGEPAETGAPAGAGDHERVAAAVGRQLATGSGEAVVKPTVSAGSKDTLRVGSDPSGSDDLAAGIALGERLLASGRAVLVQPYQRSVDRRGETGLVFFDGVFSHAFTKGPILRRGGELVTGPFAEERISPAVATDDELVVAAAALQAVPGRSPAEPLLYARVDLVHDDDGRPVVLELELCEPSFFIEVDQRAADRFARAVRDRLGR